MTLQVIKSGFERKTRNDKRLNEESTSIYNIHIAFILACGYYGPGQVSEAGI
jgi:hypothetical protein